MITSSEEGRRRALLRKSIQIMIGQRFGRLIVERESIWQERLVKTQRHYWVVCDCGVRKLVQGSSLKTGNTRSCGCLQKEKAKAQWIKHGHCSRNKHHPLYKTWDSMKARCNYPSNPSFRNYGERGIYVNPEWQTSFENFLHDMGPSWKPGLWLDRIDNDGPYIASNCRWVSPAKNLKNRRF